MSQTLPSPVSSDPKTICATVVKDIAPQNSPNPVLVSPGQRLKNSLENFDLNARPDANRVRRTLMVSALSRFATNSKNPLIYQDGYDPSALTSDEIRFRFKQSIRMLAENRRRFKRRKDISIPPNEPVIPIYSVLYQAMTRPELQDLTGPALFHLLREIVEPSFKEDKHPLRSAYRMYKIAGDPLLTDLSLIEDWLAAQPRKN